MLKYLYLHRNVRSCDSYSPCASPLALINTHKKHFCSFCSFCGPEIWRPSTKQLDTGISHGSTFGSAQRGNSSGQNSQTSSSSRPCQIHVVSEKWEKQKTETSVEVFFSQEFLRFPSIMYPIAGKLREAKTSKHWISSYSKAPWFHRWAPLLEFHPGLTKQDSVSRHSAFGGWFAFNLDSRLSNRSRADSCCHGYSFHLRVASHDQIISAWQNCMGYFITVRGHALRGALENQPRKLCLCQLPVSALDLPINCLQIASPGDLFHWISASGWQNRAYISFVCQPMTVNITIVYVYVSARGLHHEKWFHHTLGYVIWVWLTLHDHLEASLKTAGRQTFPVSWRLL